MRSAAPVVLALGLLLPAAAAAAAATKAPLAVSEKYADRFVFEAGFGWDTLPSAKVKATFTVPFDPLFTGEESPATVVSFLLGDLAFESTLGEAAKYVPGRSASWVVIDDFTGKPFLRVKAAWKNGVLKVVAGAKGEAGAYSDFYVGEEDLVIDGDVLDASLSFGRAEYEFTGGLSGIADTSVKVKAGDEYDVSKVTLAGTADLASQPEDFDAPLVDIFEPFQDDELDTVPAEVVWSAYDDTSLAVLEFRVNGGAWTPLGAEVVVDPDFGDASAEGTFAVDTSAGGPFTVEIRALDAFGKETVESVDFTVVLP